MGCGPSTETPGASCDQTGKRLAFGDWYHRVGAVGEPSYDLCGEAFEKLTPDERTAYVQINSNRDFRVAISGGSRSSKAEDVSRPAEVPCAKCGASTYFQEGETKRKCFKCGQPLDRSGQGARGLESSKEAKESKQGGSWGGGKSWASQYGVAG